jgi:hypothetical protein
MTAPGLTNDDSAGYQPAPSVEHFNDSACKQIGKLMTTVQLNPEASTATPATPDQRQPITIDRLLDAPLAELIAEADVELVVSSITDETFFGAFVARKGQRTFLMMRAGLSDIENDVITRYLIGQSLHMDLTPLPAPFETEFGPLIPGVPMGGAA